MKKILLGRKDIVKNIIKNPIAQAFFLNFLLAFFSFIYFIIVNKGLFTLCDDINIQDIPLGMLANNAIKKGNILWNWNIDIGSSFIGGTSYYMLGSPFFWLSCFFPENWFPFLIGWLYMLKYAVAGATSYYYIQIFCKNKKYALIGSILYAFSGFQATNLLFYHFHDIVAIFPLTLIGLEKLMNENKKGIFAFSIFLSAILNFYFFIAEVIFLIFYFIVRFWLEDFKAWKRIGICVLEGCMGILMASILFIPTIAFNIDNPRVSVMLPRESWFDFERRYFLKIIRVFLFPADTMSSPTYVLDQDFSSWSAYLPMVGMILVFCYLLKRKRNWLTRILLCLILFVITPILNSSFFLFSSTNYHRWYFMLLLILSLTSAKVLENRNDYPIKIMSIIFAIGTVGITVISYWWNAHKFELIYDSNSFILLVSIALIGMGITFLITLVAKKEVIFFRGMLIGISLFAVITTAFVTREYKNYASGEEGNENSTLYYDRMMAMKQIEDEAAYRVDSRDNVTNMAGENKGIGSFSSTVNGSIFELYDALGGEARKVFTPIGPEGTKELLSTKYYVSEEKEDAIQTIMYGRYIGYVHEYENAIPIGFTYDTYLLRTEFEKIDPTLRAKLMLDTLVIPDEKEKEVSNFLSHYTTKQKEILVDKTLGQLVEQHQQECSNNFKQENSYFATNIYADNDKYAFFSVPYDVGWKANVNGIDAQIIKINGLMAVPVKEGNNNIEFKYNNYYLYIGIGCSIVGFLIWYGYYKKIEWKHLKETNK